MLLIVTRDDNNKQLLLDLIVELCDKRVDKLLFIGYWIGTGTGISYRYRYTVPIRYSQFTLDNGKSQSATPAR